MDVVRVDESHHFADGEIGVPLSEGKVGYVVIGGEVVPFIHGASFCWVRKDVGDGCGTEGVPATV